MVFGGIKGRSLCTKTAAVLEEFQHEWALFSAATYDPLEPDSNAFLDDYLRFQSRSQDFDRRLAAIFVQAFDECFDVDGLFKVIAL